MIRTELPRRLPPEEGLGVAPEPGVPLPPAQMPLRTDGRLPEEVMNGPSRRAHAGEDVRLAPAQAGQSERSQLLLQITNVAVAECR